MKPIIPNMNDRELDDLFREAAVQYSPAHTDEVWLELERRLDETSEQQQSPRRRWKYLFLLLLAIPGFYTWQLLRIPSGKVAFEQPLAHLTHKKTDNLDTTPNKSAHSLQEMIPEQEFHDKGSTRLRVFTSHKQIHGRILSPASIQNSREEAIINQPVITSEQSIHHLPVLEKSPARTAGIVQKNLPDQLLSGMAKPFLDSTIISAKSDRSTDLKTAIKKIKQKSSLADMNHWSFGLTIGPDWSSASAKGWKTGVGGGVKLTYRLNNKWALNTGVLLDKKLYNAYPNDYHPSDDSWRNYDVKNIGAQCRVLDVPLNVEYSFWYNNKQRAFLGTGLSSFWMLKEKYTYSYKTTSGSMNQWDKELYDQNHHLFSIINLSAGYERTWQHFSIVVAPYLKVPVTGIGYGKVKLYSTGIHFTLNYGLK